MYEQVRRITNAKAPTVFERIESLEANVAGHEKGYGVRIDRLQEDMRFLAGVLGVTLPSNEPREVSDCEDALAPRRN